MKQNGKRLHKLVQIFPVSEVTVKGNVVRYTTVKVEKSEVSGELQII